MPATFAFAGMARSYPRAQPGRIKTELTGASIVFGAGHARDESLDVPIVPQDFLPAWNIRKCPYFPYFPIFLYSPSISRRSPRLKVAESCCREISLSP